MVRSAKAARHDLGSQIGRVLPDLPVFLTSPPVPAVAPALGGNPRRGLGPAARGRPAPEEQVQLDQSHQHGRPSGGRMAIPPAV